MRPFTASCPEVFDVFIASRLCLRPLDVRDRVRRLVPSRCTVTDPHSFSTSGGTNVNCLDSDECSGTGGPSLPAAGSHRDRRNEGDLDEYRFRSPHIDVECEWVELGSHRAERPVLVHLSNRGKLSVSLRNPPGNGGDSRRAVTASYRRSLECLSRRPESREGSGLFETGPSTRKHPVAGLNRFAAAHPTHTLQSDCRLVMESAGPAKHYRLIVPHQRQPTLVAIDRTRGRLIAQLRHRRPSQGQAGHINDRVHVLELHGGASPEWRPAKCCSANSSDPSHVQVKLREQCGRGSIERVVAVVGHVHIPVRARQQIRPEHEASPR